MPPTGDLARNPGKCPDWELNQRPFGSQASTQSTELYQPGPSPSIYSSCLGPGHRVDTPCPGRAPTLLAPGVLVLGSVESARLVPCTPPAPFQLHIPHPRGHNSAETDTWVLPYTVPGWPLQGWGTGSKSACVGVE